MQNLHDNELDEFFRKSSENPKITFNPRAWELMDKKLQKIRLRSLIYNRIKYLSIFILFLVVSFTIWRRTSYSENNKKIVQKPKNTPELNYGYRTSVKQEKTAELTPASAEFNLKSYSTSRLETIVKDSFGTSAEQKQINTHGLSMDKKQNVHSRIGEGKEEKNHKVNVVLPAELNTPPKNTDLRRNDMNAFVSEESSFKNALLNEPNKKSAYFKGPILKTISLEFNTDTTYFEEKKVLNKRPFESPKIRISASISPDYSGALNLGNIQTGYNSSLILEYFILKNLSVSSGIIKSRKFYSAEATDYKPYQGYWAKYKRPDDIDGDCSILDIPLNLRYYYSIGKKIRLFGGGGISSYLMQKEVYIYQYNTYDYPVKKSKENNHFFSVLNISAGIEHRVGNRWTVGFEPFYKLPLAGVGFGKVKLNSGGAFLSINYTLIKK